MTEKKATYQGKKPEELYCDLQKWKSNIEFIDDEMTFINRLLHSYVFEPRTPNLFERLELFKIAYKKSIQEKEKIKELIGKHESTIGGILECASTACDLAYNQKHEELSKRVSKHLANYIKLKSDIYNYAGSILKRKKPSK
ncbi:hypothetical protein [Flagellimonas sp.]|uniref:hypothetical protein n=1 Tax=Flagellimonas sp. TaxID=2058762 RepID=UPI003F4A430C